jgi:hypothetical protein
MSIMSGGRMFGVAIDWAAAVLMVVPRGAENEPSPFPLQDPCHSKNIEFSIGYGYGTAFHRAAWTT